MRGHGWGQGDGQGGFATPGDGVSDNPWDVWFLSTALEGDRHLADSQQIGAGSGGMTDGNGCLEGRFNGDGG